MAEQVIMDSNEDILKVFEQFVQMYGIEALREPRRIIAFVTDLEPKLIEYAYCISKAYHLNIPQKIESGVIVDSNDAKKAMETFDSDDGLSEIVLSVIEAFGSVYGRNFSLRPDYSTGIQIPYQAKKGEGLVSAMEKLDHIRWFLNNYNHYKWNNGNDSLNMLRSMMNFPERHKDEIKNQYKAIVHEFQNDPYKASIKIVDEVKTNGFSSSSFSDYFVVIGEEPVSVEFACYHGGPEVDQSIELWKIKEKNFKEELKTYRNKLANATVPDNWRADFIVNESRKFILWSIGIIACITLLFRKISQDLNLVEMITIARKDKINVLQVLWEYHKYKNLSDFLIIMLPIVVSAITFIVLLIFSAQTMFRYVKSRKYAYAYRTQRSDMKVIDDKIAGDISKVNSVIVNYYKGISIKSKLVHRDYLKFIQSISETKYGTNVDALKLKSVPEIGKKCREIIVICVIVIFVLSRMRIYPKAALGSQQINQIMINTVQRKNSYLSPIALEYNGHYYDVYADAASWEDAKEKCESMGGHLATLTTLGEDTEVYGFLRQSGYKTAYLGLKMRKVKKGKKKKEVWYWIAGKKKKVSYAHWAEGEPDTGEDGDCIYGAYGTTDESAWRALSASYTYIYICEWDSMKKAKREP